jgi:hypothetical protein
MKTGTKFWSFSLLAFVVFVSPSLLPAQWALYGNSGRPHTLLEAPGGGWVIAGVGNIFRLSPSGSVVWGRRFDSGPPYSYCRQAWSTPDGGIVAAVDENFGGIASLFKLSSSGNIVWQKTYSQASGQMQAVCPVPDGGTLLAGQAEGKLILCRLTASGEIAWQKSYATGRFENATATAATSDGGFFVLSSSWPADGATPGGSELWVLRVDAMGEIEWQKLIGGAAAETGEFVRQTPDGGCLIAGHSASFDPDGKDLFWLIKLSADGAVERQSTFGHAYGGTDWLSLRPAADGTFIAALRPAPLTGAYRVILVTIAADGAIVRESSYLAALDSVEALAMQPTADGGCVLSLTGFSYSGYATNGGAGDTDSHVLKVAPSGQIEWQHLYGSAYSLDSIGVLGRAADGTYLLAGATSSWGDLADATWIMKTASDGSINPNCFFIKTAAVGPLTEPGTSKEVLATVADTAAVTESGAGIGSEAADIHFTAWGAQTGFRHLGQPTSTLTIGSQDDYGTTTPEAGNYAYETGSYVQIRATPKTDYTFVSWTGNIVSSHSSIGVVLDGDKTIIATYRWNGENPLDEIVEKYCFIATAAYGDPSHPDVEVLRQVRDRYLKKSRAGRAFVELYYRYSPPAAGFVSKHPFLSEFSRIMLYPAVAIGRALIQ